MWEGDLFIFPCFFLLSMFTATAKFDSVCSEQFLWESRSQPEIARSARAFNDNRACLILPDMSTAVWPTKAVFLYLPWPRESAFRNIGAHSHFFGENSRPYGVLMEVFTFHVLKTSSEEPLSWKMLRSKEEISDIVSAKAHVRAMWEKRSKTDLFRGISGVRKLWTRLS